MESTEERKYAVIITEPAANAFYEILEYLYAHYPIDRAEEIAGEIRDTAGALEYNPERGIQESRLMHRGKAYRFILYKRTQRAEIKIIYFIDHGSSVVYVTDFFPTEKDDRKMADRNS